MTVQPILRYPDPGLSIHCEPVTSFDDELKTLVDDLIDTMRAAPGVGITAAHIGIHKRVFVLELTQGEVQVFVNPITTNTSKETSKFTEGSVSMPGFTDEVERPASLTLEYADICGKKHVLEAKGFLSTCIQHEIDQLDGIFWLKRLSRIKRERLVKKWEKQNRDNR